MHNGSVVGHLQSVFYTSTQKLLPLLQENAHTADIVFTCNYISSLKITERILMRFIIGDLHDGLPETESRSSSGKCKYSTSNQATTTSFQIACNFLLNILSLYVLQSALLTTSQISHKIKQKHAYLSQYSGNTKVWTTEKL